VYPLLRVLDVLFGLVTTTSTADVSPAAGHPVVEGSPATLRRTHRESVALTVPELLVSPKAAFFGDLAVIWLAVTVTSVAARPPIETVAPAKKFEPLICSAVDPPGQPISGETDVTVGAALISSDRVEV
jgi:hypothetical protein